MKTLPTNQCFQPRVITEKELEHFQFIFDRIEGWRKQVNDKSIRVGIMYDQNEIAFKKFWNDSVGKSLDALKIYLGENWMIEDKDLGLVDIKDYIRWHKLE